MLFSSRDRCSELALVVRESWIFVYLCMFLGHLFFANVISEDSLNDNKYVCIANNPFLGAHVQGHDQKVVPSEVPGRFLDDGQSMIDRSINTNARLSSLRLHSKTIFFRNNN